VGAAGDAAATGLSTFARAPRLRGSPAHTMPAHRLKVDASYTVVHAMSRMFAERSTVAAFIFP